jgi:inorganic phosphate transporter, PiT family
MLDIPIIVILGVVAAVIFDFGNGLNDAANAISTVVATRTLTMRQAIIMSAAANFIGAFIFGVAVATTIGKGLVDPSIVTPEVVFAGLIGAIAWVYITTYYGLPISASHSLIGGFIGSAIAAAGFRAVIYSGLTKIIIFIFLAPILGFLIAFGFYVLVLHICRKADPKKASKHFKKLQILSALVYSLAHGTNDAQKTMGIISVLLFSAGLLGPEFHVPFWVVLLSHGTIALGTLAGGWQVVKTMGMKITKLQTTEGFSAETAGSAVVISSTLFGIPVSTTHVISGSIMGVGAVKRTSAVRWAVARKIVWAWVLTIPISGAVGALMYFTVRLFS